ncbi:MAG: bifunctional riboflavin kinase/FAD synthetase [Candidatus Hydrogenedentes bacterium]|nr:bifunctional riboflavin kinase/FAD synthetase [Candidatus Hydrogenedentota bacterium]
MEIIRDVTTRRSAYPGLVLTIGSFDGIHLGHQRILQSVIERARAIGGAAALMSLWPHPKVFFGQGDPIPLLTDPEQKETLLRELGIDVYFILPFNEAIARMEPVDFLESVIHRQCGAVRVVVGHDFSFGAGARGDFDLLAREGKRLGIEAEMVPAVECDGGRVSSTRIRSLVGEGDMDAARRLLGRPYAVAGVVERGRGLGNGLGYPTANIAPAQGLLPARGIYAARAALNGTTYDAAVNVGIAPTLPHEQPVLEAHLLDFEGDLSGRRLEVELWRRIRPEKKFDSVDALKEGIGKDIVTIRQYFAASPA